MTTEIVDLSVPGGGVDRAADLAAYLGQLVGEPFRAQRYSYGDELTLHFGDLRPAKSPKLKGKPLGTYVLSLQASGWVIKSARSVYLTKPPGPAGDTPLSTERKGLEEGFGAITPGARVLSAHAFPIEGVESFGLHVSFSDGTAVSVVPRSDVGDEEPDDAPLADWELLSPGGLLRAGPGYAWAFRPKAVAT